MITSPRRIRRMFVDHERSIDAHNDDPISQSCGCLGEIVAMQNRSFERRLRKATGLTVDQAMRIIEEWEAARRPDTPRSRWKAADRARRYHAAMMAEWEESDAQ